MAGKLYHLKNGTPVAIDVMSNTDLASIGIYFNVGTRHENKKNNGVAHFLEHMLLKGTKHRTAQQLNAETEEAGFDLEAATTHENTSYVLTGLGSDSAHMIEILSDMVTNSILPPKEIKRERGTILEERSSEDFGELLDRLTRVKAYSGQPFGADILGLRKNIETMNARTLRNFMNTHYHAGNMIISVAGNVDPEQVLADLEKTVGSMPARMPSTYQPAVYKGGHRHYETQSDQFHLSLAFNAYAQSDPDYWTSRLLAMIMGVGYSSRLYEEVRNKRGLVYDVHASSLTALDTGLFEIQADINPRNVAKLVPVLCDEIRKVRDEGVTERELARAKKQLLVLLAESEITPQDRMQSMADDVSMAGRLVPAEEMRQKIESVTLSAINAVAHHIFSGKLTLATAGPGRRAASYENFQRRLDPS